MARKTLLIISQNHEPSFNLATEEHLLKKSEDNIIFLYINRPSVIVGKHQNTLSEINLPFVEENFIPVYRRLSGGGTVYHDEGNINFCLIETGEPGKLVNFKKSTTKIVAVLNEGGFPVIQGNRNDLLLGGKKISGNACHVFKSRAMHHGTLLYNSNLEVLNQSIMAEGFRFKDKSVKSVRSQVTNLIQASKTKESPLAFMEQLGQKLINRYNAQLHTLTEGDLDKIKTLQHEKYDTWKWNYGYSPVFEFEKALTKGPHTLKIKLKVEKGVIIKAELLGNLPDELMLKQLEEVITGKYHEKIILLKALESIFLEGQLPENSAAPADGTLLNRDTMMELLF